MVQTVSFHARTGSCLMQGVLPWCTPGPLMIGPSNPPSLYPPTPSAGYVIGLQNHIYDGEEL